MDIEQKYDRGNEKLKIPDCLAISEMQIKVFWPADGAGGVGRGSRFECGVAATALQDASALLAR
ncbi:MAG TPA: hypothetical protein VGV18_09265 [Verrucomicrobiae bacterium]|nr:hypothetical protein [Verrucomicrobiae bacterium]